MVHTHAPTCIPHTSLINRTKDWSLVFSVDSKASDHWAIIGLTISAVFPFGSRTEIGYGLRICICPSTITCLFIIILHCTFSWNHWWLGYILETFYCRTFSSSTHKFIFFPYATTNEQNTIGSCKCLLYLGFPPSSVCLHCPPCIEREIRVSHRLISWM